MYERRIQTLYIRACRFYESVKSDANIKQMFFLFIIELGNDNRKLSGLDVNEQAGNALIWV